ncbi:helix-turn-helix transcriptional regulator [Streptomyces sp. 8K308]|uniref:helix-turn-helix domain-containing protein n=1 Tax=Streptomyces sp. 8K308 TaxID=2530388 RepID=UPI003266E237
MRWRSGALGERPMAQRSTPTGRQRRLATELRRIREHAAIPVGEAARLLGVDRTMVSNIEAGRTGITNRRFGNSPACTGAPTRL